jgi:glycosyltransferase involved in cell wall biosynthesis
MMESKNDLIQLQTRHKSPLKNILFTNVGADLYGADYVLLSLIKSLDKNRFRSFVLLPYDGPLLEELQKVGAEVEVRNLPVLRRGIFSPKGIFLFAWQMLASIVFLLGFSKKNKIDIFHTNTASLWSPAFASWILRKPHIWQIMELVEKPRLVRVLMAKITGSFSTRVFCISDAVRNHFLEDNKGKDEKFTTLYHGVDLNDYDPARANGKAIREKLAIPEESLLVLYAGRFSEWKGQDVLASAIQHLSADKDLNPLNLKFVFLGSCFQGYEHCKEDLERSMQNLVEKGSVFIHGFQRNLPDWMAASDIFVLPSKRPEPNATVLIAAMAMGLPCIGTRIGGTIETIQDQKTGLLVEPDSPQDLADSILCLAKNPEMRKDMGRSGRARALEFFSLENYCKKITDFYERV